MHYSYMAIPIQQVLLYLVIVHVVGERGRRRINREGEKG